jgi:hypothetical protein
MKRPKRDGDEGRRALAKHAARGSIEEPRMEEGLPGEDASDVSSQERQGVSWNATAFTTRAGESNARKGR